MWYWHGMGLWGWLMMVAFWAVVIFAIIWAIRSATAPTRRDEQSSLRILDERYARGEINREEYQERREVLESNR